MRRQASRIRLHPTFYIRTAANRIREKHISPEKLSLFRSFKGFYRNIPTFFIRQSASPAIVRSGPRRQIFERRIAHIEIDAFVPQREFQVTDRDIFNRYPGRKQAMRITA